MWFWRRILIFTISRKSEILVISISEWISYSQRKINSPKHCLKLESWQGPPHINKTKQREIVLSFKASLFSQFIQSWKQRQSVYLVCWGMNKISQWRSFSSPSPKLRSAPLNKWCIQQIIENSVLRILCQTNPTGSSRPARECLQHTRKTAKVNTQVNSWSISRSKHPITAVR